MKPKVLVIVGPTSSGKTSLAINLAKEFNGEVISADSRQVYKGLDLCSGKVTDEEMDNTPHHLLDVADPMTDVYTVSDFVRDANAAVADISGRGKLPIIAGGTFFYIDTLLGKMSAPAVPPNPQLRASLEAESLETLVAKLTALDPKRAANIDEQNPRRLIRAIEIATELGHVPPPIATDPYDTCTLGIDLATDPLRYNIHIRLHKRLKNGLVNEVRELISAGISHAQLESFGLEARYISRYLRGLLDYEVAIHELETKTHQFAKRQKTWLKRDTSINWIQKNDLAHIHQIVASWLST